MKKLLLSLIFTLLSLHSIVSAAEFFTINDYEVDITISGENHFEVTERIVVTFSMQRQGIFKEIPIKYNLSDGSTRKLTIFDIEVEDWEKKITESKGIKKIRIGTPGQYVDSTQTYIIHYKVGNAFLFNEDFTEFYWNVIGDKWPVIIENASFSVVWPDTINLSRDDIQTYGGYPGENTKRIRTDLVGNKLDGVLMDNLIPGQALTVAIKLPKNAIAKAPFFTYLWIDYKLFAIPLGMLILLIGVYARYGWDAPVKRTIQYHPPKDLTPSEAGILIDDRANNRDILALIPYWAVQGIIELKELEPGSGGFFGKKGELELTKLNDLPEDRPKYEEVVFKALFKGRTSVSTQQLKNKFATTLHVAKTMLQKEVIKKQLYTKASVRWSYAFPLIYFGGFFGMGISVAFNWLFLIIPFLAIFFLGLILQGQMLKKNQKGRKIYRELSGFKRFLEQGTEAELQEQIDKDPAYFDKTLPYAVAFNLTTKWTKKFEPFSLAVPFWYHTYHREQNNNNLMAFGQQFDSGLSTVQSAFSSSTSSGGSVGGSSGGGFGGGGGGSW